MVEILVDFWGGCLQMMTPYNLLIILLGSLVGTVVGALPGLGPSAGLALMIPMTFTLDATEEDSLVALPLAEVDVVIVAIGENLSASVRVIAMLKKNGVKRIMARAVDEVHKMILEAFGLERILTPEKDAARSLVRLLNLQLNVESFSITDNYYVAKFSIPENFVGMQLKDLTFEKDFNLKIIALVRGKKITNPIGVSILEHRVANEFTENLVLDKDDQLV